MRVKKYLVETMPEAMSQIRQELGKDAVIVSTKQVKVGGFVGLFRKPMIEVTAAVDEELKAKSQAVRPSTSAPARAAVPASKARNAYVSSTPGQTEAALSSFPQLTDKELSQKVDQDRIMNGSLQAHGSPSELEAAKSFAKQLSLIVEQQAASKPQEQARLQAVPQAEPPTQAKLLQADARLAGSDQNLRNEIMEMKSMMKAMLQGQEQDAWPEYVKQMHRRLLDQGVNSEIAHRYVREALMKAQQLSSTIASELAFKPQLKAILQELLIASASPKLPLETRVVYFAGPTGVGKTTTIAKLAADQMFQHRRKVGFITADTYRIAAVEQLRTYASILNAPIEVVTSPNDLGRALQALEDCDLILMDTAGRNYRNELYVNELYSMIKPNAGSETFLVLSMTMKMEDILGILERFKHHQVERFVFTKADETDTFGLLINLAELTSIPISYITYGQNVPNDIKPFVPEEWIDKLLGE